MSIITMRIAGHFPQTLRPIVYALQNLDRNFRILWRHLQTDLRIVYCVTKCIIWYSNKWRKQRPNRCIIGDAILPQTGTKLTKKRGSKFGALLWRHLMPQRKTAIEVHNYSPSCNEFTILKLLKKNFGKFTSYMTFVRSKPFLDS